MNGIELRRQWWAVFLVAALTLVGCGTRAQLDESFTVEAGKTATIAGANLRLTVDSLGHEIASEEGGGAVFAELTATSGGESEAVYLEVGDERAVGDYTVKLVRVDESLAHCELVVRPG